MSSVLPVRTARLVLRAFSDDDLNALYDIHRRPEVARFLRSDTRTRGEVRAMLKRRLGETDLVKEGDSLAVAVVVRDSGALIGDFNLELLDADSGRAEIGFVLNPTHAGQGYATEAGCALLRLAFEHYGFHRVIGLCNGRNSSSMNLMERLGMRREGFFVQSEVVKGKRVDVASYAILRQEWLGRRPVSS
ncbi:MAG TPA: GNAT family protein [Pseudonocardiaceae bacterium]|nr:GNAT family protein [Pseudonocardiaceae bacterium]